MTGALPDYRNIIDIDFGVQGIMRLRYGGDGLLQSFIVQHGVKVEVYWLIRNLKPW